MTIIFNDGKIDIYSGELGDLHGDSMLLYHVAKLLWEHPENTIKEEEMTKAGRTLRFDFWLEKQVAADGGFGK